MASVIKPIEVTDDVLVSAECTIPEPDISGGDPSVYSGSATYANAARVTVLATHKIYESIADGNIGNYPPDDILLDDPKWAEVGYTNRWRAFDQYVNTESSRPESLKFTLDATRTSSVALFNVKGKSVTLQLYGADGSLGAETTVNLVRRTTTRWLDYFFGEFDYSSSVVWTYPIGFGTKLVVTISAPGGTASVGVIKHGRTKYIGRTMRDISSGIVDFSTKTEDPTYGRVYLKQGPYHDLKDVKMYISTESLENIDRFLKSLRAIPCVWVLNDKDGNSGLTTLYGYFKDFGVVIGSMNPFTLSECSLKLESLV
jgi:hypothetical protein